MKRGGSLTELRFDRGAAWHGKSASLSPRRFSLLRAILDRTFEEPVPQKRQQDVWPEDAKASL